MWSGTVQMKYKIMSVWLSLQEKHKKYRNHNTLYTYRLFQFSWIQDFTGPQETRTEESTFIWNYLDVWMLAAFFPWNWSLKVSRKNKTPTSVALYCRHHGWITAAIQQFLFVQLNYSRMKGPREPECSAVPTFFLAETLSPLHYWAAQKSLQGSPENPIP